MTHRLAAYAAAASLDEYKLSPPSWHPPHPAPARHQNRYLTPQCPEPTPKTWTLLAPTAIIPTATNWTSSRSAASPANIRTASTIEPKPRTPAPKPGNGRKPGGQPNSSLPPQPSLEAKNQHFRQQHNARILRVKPTSTRTQASELAAKTATGSTVLSTASERTMTARTWRPSVRAPHQDPHKRRRQGPHWGGYGYGVSRNSRPSHCQSLKRRARLRTGLRR